MPGYVVPTWFFFSSSTIWKTATMIDWISVYLISQSMIVVIIITINSRSGDINSDQLLHMSLLTLFLIIHDSTQ